MQRQARPTQRQERGANKARRLASLRGAAQCSKQKQTERNKQNKQCAKQTITKIKALPAPGEELEGLASRTWRPRQTITNIINITIIIIIIIISSSSSDYPAKYESFIIVTASQISTARPSYSACDTYRTNVIVNII